MREVSLCSTCNEMDGIRRTLTRAHMHAKAQVRSEQTHRNIAIAPEERRVASLASSKLLCSSALCNHVGGREISQH